MLRKAAAVLLVLVGTTGGVLADPLISRNGEWMEEAVVKLIEKYYELSQRVERLEKQLAAEKKDAGTKEKDDGIKEKYQSRTKLRVRSCPRTRCSIVAVLEKGEVVSLVSRRGKWAFIETSDGVKGWVEGRYLQEYSY